MESTPKLNLYLPASILLAAILVSGSLFYTRFSGTPGEGADKGAAQAIKNVQVSADDDSYMGDKSAPVKMIEFSDYQCPFCRTFWKETFPSIKRDYIDTGKVVFIYRDFPLSFHPAAHISAQSAQCAGDQGKYWEMQDKIFGEQDKKGSGTIQYGATDLKKWAQEIGLDMNKFNQCLDSEKFKAEVDKDLADGSKAGVNGTPSSFVNGQLIVGAQPYPAFKVIIDEELKKVGSKKNSFFK